MIDTDGFQIVLGSKSPRRQELLKGLGLEFQLRTKETEEIYPKELANALVPEYLAEIKARELLDSLAPNEILITSDTIVLSDNEIMGKPVSSEDAFEMLQKLSGKAHEVITGVHLRSLKQSHSFSVVTKVYFKDLSPEDIHYYVDNYKPYDKAGAYGIQEWIGYTGIERLEGSYYNVMGLPVAELWEALKAFLLKEKA